MAALSGPLAAIELTLELQEAEVDGRKFVVIIRAYDDSVAVRYRLPEQGEVVVVEDNTHFMFADDFTCWCVNGERPNYGPQAVSEFEAVVPQPNQRHFPLTLKVAEDCYAAVLEAAIYDFNYMSPKGVAPNGIRTLIGKNKVIAPINTSWRVLLLGKTAGSLITNNALVNLNPPCQIKDPHGLRPVFRSGTGAAGVPQRRMALPMSWDETIVLDGAIGEYISTARRSGKKWWIGTACNEQGRKQQIRLDFLKKGVEYTATIYEDAPDANYKTNREAYTVRSALVRRGDVIEAVLAQGGGHAVFLEPR